MKPTDLGETNRPIKKYKKKKTSRNKNECKRKQRQALPHHIFQMIRQVKIQNKPEGNTEDANFGNSVVTKFSLNFITPRVICTRPIFPLDRAEERLRSLFVQLYTVFQNSSHASAGKMKK